VSTANRVMNEPDALLQDRLGTPANSKMKSKRDSVLQDKLG
jgi:hypothetical protein